MITNGNGILNQIANSNRYTYQSNTFDKKLLNKFLKKLSKPTFKKHWTMRQDLNGEELSIGDRILVCVEKDYGWLGYARIVGETPLSWKINIEDTNTYNRGRNFEKNPKRIIKVDG